MVLPREEHRNWFSSSKMSALETYIQVTLYKLNRLYLRLYIIMHAITSIEKGGHAFDKHGEWYIGGFERKKGKREML